MKNLINIEGNSFGKVVTRKGGIIWSNGAEYVDLEIKVVWELKIFANRTLA